MNSGRPEGLPPSPDAPSRPLTILDTLSEEQIEEVGNISVQAVASFHEELGRLPTKGELGRIVTLAARWVMAPGAPSYEVQ